MKAKKSNTAKYYAENPEAAEKRRAYQRKLNKRPDKKKYRAELVKINRKAGTYGNGDGKDYDHGERKFMSAKKNRSKKFEKGGKVDPKEKKGKKYDGRRGLYPVGVHKTGIYRQEKFEAEDAPKEAGRLLLDERITDAIFDVGENLGASESRVDKKINRYLDKSRRYVADRLAKKIDPKAKPRLSEGETEYIPRLDKVVDKMSSLSDADINKLKSEIIRLSKEYQEIDPKSSTASKLTKAASIAANQDWSSIKPIREKAGLTKDDLVSLIQAPSDASFFEKGAFSAARGAIKFKDFRNGGKFNPFRHKRNK